MNFIEYIQTSHQIGDPVPVSSTFHWIFWCLIGFNLMAIAYVRTAQPGYISIVFRTGIYNRQIYQNIQEDLRLSSAGSFLLTIAYFNCAALVLYNLMPALNESYIFVFVGIFLAIFIIKFCFIRIIGHLTETKEGLTEHWMNHLIYFQVITMVLTPVLCLLHFSMGERKWEVMLVLAFFIMSIVLVREIQSFMRAFRNRLPMVYIILYLCTLEILPLVVLIRVLVS